MFLSSLEKSFSQSLVRYPFREISIILSSKRKTSKVTYRCRKGEKNSSLFSFLSVFCFLIGNLLRGMRFRRPRFLINALKEVLSAPPRGGNAEVDRPRGAEIVINALGSLFSIKKLVRLIERSGNWLDSSASDRLTREDR